jgi:serine O-acetyltransferase
MLENIKQDVKMYSFPSKYGPFRNLLYLLCTQELHAVMIYRFGRWTYYQCKIPLIKQLCSILYFIMRKVSELFFGIGIWPTSDIGPGLKIEHWGGIIIVAKKIGKHCRISQQVTIGHIGGFKGGGLPTLGDNVYVGAGAKILGEINIGSNVKIGANAVVITNVPDNAVAVGVPARIILPKQSQTASEDQ